MRAFCSSDALVIVIQEAVDVKDRCRLGYPIRGKLHREEANPVMHSLQRIYKPVLAWALKHRIMTRAAASGLFIFAMFLATTIGSEFMPPLNEETAMFMPITDPAISLTKATQILH
ncbi:MAG: efflux RND transporter permease subunit [Candidatus Sulfotelmatobacter sp.]